ncbi:hypothetical protein FDUTEX481_07921 [Tolypothrix sp. PCC 7601]|nr:hypothetical protein FDUTEX481_07921 [Tolypothrix sp. PCC 7601]
MRFYGNYDLSHLSFPTNDSEVLYELITHTCKDSQLSWRIQF